MRALRSLIAIAFSAGALLIGVPTTTALALGTIQPGDRMLVADTTAIGACTLGFVFDGTGTRAGKVYVATGAHCVTHVGQAVTDPEASPLPFGDVAVIGDLNASATDWSLIEVRPAFVSSVSAAFKGHPQFPTGVAAPADTTVGDPIQLTDLVAVPRPWVPLTYQDTEIYRIAGTLAVPPSTIPFDSGGPLAHVPTGKALGLVSRGLNCSLPSFICQGYEGPTIQGVIAKASTAGFPVTLRTV